MQGNHHTYGHIQCVNTVLANPNHKRALQTQDMLAWSQLVQDQLMLDGPELALVHWYRTVQDFEVLQKGSGRTKQKRCEELI
jgi:hypothetical protein